MIGTAIIAVIKEGMGTRHSTGGLGPFIIYPALLGGLYAIWKWKPEEEKTAENQKEEAKDDSDKYTLKKD
jgi:hypothetical protein